MPNVERHCTYSQSMDYFVKYCDFISAADLDRICGQTALKLLGAE